MTERPRAAALQRQDGVAIAYDIAGDGPLVLFVHGLTSSRRAWDPVTSGLGAGFTCVRVDLRGHGESSTATDYSMQSLVADVRAVVEEVGLGEPAVVGSSLGASVAAVYGAAYDPRAVVCIDQSLRFGDFARVVQARAEQLQGPETMQAVVSIEHALGLEPYSGVEDLERRVLGFPREVVLGVWHALLSIPPDQLTATAEALLPRISAPLLSLHGSPPPPDYEPWLTRLVPQARVEAWNGTGHMLHLVDPGRFISRVRHCSRAATWIGTASRTSGGFTIVAPVAQMHELEREECLKLLERGGFGRLAVNAGGGAPAIRPVNYVFDHSSQSVVFRTAPGSKLHGLLRSGRAAFEIDGTDPVDRTGWSVVVVGAAEEVTGASELRRLEQSGLEPWGPGEKPHWMRIRATTISGRKITRD